MLRGFSNPKDLLKRGFAFAFTFFCAYIQTAPTVDLDWVTINGHDYNIGAENAPQQHRATPNQQCRRHLGNQRRPNSLNASKPAAVGQLPAWQVLAFFVIERSQRVYVQIHYQPVDNRGPPAS
jgi:hypothetical protein